MDNGIEVNDDNCIGAPSLPEASSLQQVCEWAVATAPFIPQVVPPADIRKTISVVRELVSTAAEQLITELGEHAVVAIVSLCMRNDPSGDTAVVVLELCCVPAELRALIEFNATNCTFRMLADAVVVNRLSDAARARLQGPIG